MNSQTLFQQKKHQRGWTSFDENPTDSQQITSQSNFWIIFGVL